MISGKQGSLPTLKLDLYHIFHWTESSENLGCAYHAQKLQVTLETCSLHENVM